VQSSETKVDDVTEYQAGKYPSWEFRYKQLLEYRNNHNGDCNVPRSYPPNKPLAIWVMTQRCQQSLKLRGKKFKLTDEREKQLNEIGFQWRVNEEWDNRYDQLVQYRNQHGHCNVPQLYPPNEPLGPWVMKQRCQHSLKLRGEKSQLTDEREKLLNDIEFSWVAPGHSKRTVTMLGDEEAQLDSPCLGPRAKRSKKC
jgi:Helicase associated domain